MIIRAKMQVNEVTSSVNSDKVSLSPVIGNSEDNKSWARYTPAGKLELQIDNPALKGAVKAGQQFWVDLTPIEEPAKQ